MTVKLKKTVVLVGMMGAGKSAVGKALAASLHVPFIDSDEEIEKAANMTIAEIFARDGEPFFRRKESQVIERLLGSQSGILSTGGGAFLDPANLLRQRVRHKDSRPLLRSADPRGTLEKIFKARVPIYALADLKVKADPSYSIETMATKVRDALHARPDVLEDDT